MSVGHRDSIRRFHQVTLHLDSHGGWTLNPSPSHADDDDGGGGGGGGGGDGGGDDRWRRGDVENQVEDSQGIMLAGIQVTDADRK